MEMPGPRRQRDCCDGASFGHPRRDVASAAGTAHVRATDTQRFRPATMVDTTALAAHLDNVLRDATIPELPNHYRGKVRDNYDLPDRRRILIATDRLSAFDRILTAIPLKGQ